MRPAKPFSDSRERGIALLVTIVLLVFLVLIVVAMSSLVRVETQISVNTQSLAQAKQNALFGLNTAIGKLQETAGPDQRVTARADLVVAAGSPQVNLTGVWDTSGGAPVLITWLVNGNEDPAAPLNVTPDALTTSESNSSSRIMDANDLGDHPLVDSLYDDVSPIRIDFGGGFQFGDGHVYLVAKGSVDLKTAVGYKGAAGERVILRKTPIIVDGSKVAGRAPNNDVTVGNYAFWVTDDGIKASLGTGNRTPLVEYDDSALVANGLNYDPPVDSAADPAYINRKMLSSLQIQGPRLDLALRDFSATDILRFPARRDFYGLVAHPETEDLRNSLLTPYQLEYGVFSTPFSNPTLTIAATSAFTANIHDRLKQNFHDVTPHSYSVLTNMISGGLRRDLSQAAEVTALLPLSFQKAVEAFVNSWRTTGGFSKPLDATTNVGLLQQVVTISPPDASSFGAGETAFPIVPIISEFELFLDLATDAAGIVNVTPKIRLELWNPYNSILALPAGESLYVRIPLVVGSAEVFAAATIDDGVAAAVPMNLARTLGWNGTDADFALVLLLTPDAAGDWKPGEIKLWSATDALKQAKDAGGVPITGFTVSSGDLFVLDNGPNLVDVELLKRDGAAVDTTLYRVTGVDFGSLAPKASIDGILCYFRLKDTENPANPNWLNGIDPRGPLVTYSVAKYAPRNLGDLQDFDSDANSLLRNDTHFVPAQVSLFDIPRQEVLGVGAFQHLVYSVNGGSYQVGSNAVGAWNEVFEKYFFSSVPRDPLTTWSPGSGDVLANTSMVVYDRAPASNTTNGALLAGLQSQNSAENLLLRDSFNINSTSVAAWRAILGGALPSLADPNSPLLPPNKDDYVWDGAAAALQMNANWRYFDGTTDRTQVVKNVFFRFPNTATNIGSDYASLLGDLVGGNAALQRTATYRLGLRELTKEQVNGIATNVVDRLKVHPARPFVTVKAFIESGILQSAIDFQTDVNEPTIGFPIPKYSPGHLSQADILQLVGHRLVARSDTFTIRAYGDVLNPLSGAVEARAWVEATVQRTPAKHSTSADNGNNMTSTGGGAGNFGRQFKVISLRWLSADEI